jgi:hypothetical protein
VRHAFARAVFEWQYDFPDAPSGSAATAGFRRVLAKAAVVVSAAGAGMAWGAQLVKNIREIQIALPAAAEALGVGLPSGLAPRQLPASTEHAGASGADAAEPSRP